MAIMFSRVTMSNDDYGTSDFLVSGYPQSAEDLEGWSAFEGYTEDIEDPCAIDVFVDVFLYGEGEIVDATPEEVAYMMMRINRDSDFLEDRCTNLGNRNFVIDWDGGPVSGMEM